MTYLKDFRERLSHNDYPGFLKIWEEYCYGDQPDGKEIIEILESVKASELPSLFGQHVERILPLWRDLKDEEESHAVLRLIFDLQTSNSEELAELAIGYLKHRYPEDPLLQDKLRLVGLRNKEQFSSAIRNFELLNHFQKGQFVFHTAGWGTGEIIDVSLIREEVNIEFEYVVGPQSFSFEKAFKTLMPIPLNHFYARRFGNPDELESLARSNPVEVIRILLHDLGPKTAAEIKEELVDLVIPNEDWNKWWQTTRGKLKKDTKIESPKELKDPFYLREKEVPHEVSFHKALEAKPEIHAAIQMIYNFLRDFPETIKNPEFKTTLEAKLQEMLEHPSLNESQKIQLLFFLEDLGHKHVTKELAELVKHLTHPEQTVKEIQSIPFQKRFLQLTQSLRDDWSTIFLELLFNVDQHLLRDFIATELNTPKHKDALKQKLGSLCVHSLTLPEVFVWYFQKLLLKDSPFPFADAAGKNQFFEALLILLDHIEEKPPYRDLAKKILSIVTANRYKVVRDIMQDSNLEEVKEYLLLATKCQSFTDHDIKILHSLGEVVHPTLTRLRKDKEHAASGEEFILWATQKGYQKTQQKIQHIATVETIQNAKEIEMARSLGDLRENAEFKAALEKRDRLQSELKLLSDQLAKARILTPEDVITDQVSVGSVVHCKDSKGSHIKFTLLGPWEADPEKHIISFQSKLAQAMKDKTVNTTFEFQGETYTITDIYSYFEQEISE